MNRTLRLSSFQVGTDPKRGQGYRISTTRRPPRGVRKSRWLRDDWFDAWLPILGPSNELRDRFKHRDKSDPDVMERFLDAYEREMLGRGESRQTIAFLAGLALRIPISISCFCEDEAFCHRSRLRLLIERAAKKIPA